MNKNFFLITNLLFCTITSLKLITQTYYIKNAKTKLFQKLKH